jgi:Leucine-rich repeat (LRR) protein
MSKYSSQVSHKVKTNRSSSNIKVKKDSHSKILSKLSLLDILQGNHCNKTHLLQGNDIRATGDATGVSIYSLGIFPASLSSSIRLLYLSNNSLVSLNNIQQFKNLETLTVAGNEIAYYEDLVALKDLPSLTSLDLRDNKVTDLPYFYDYILSLCPGLKILIKDLTGYSKINEEKLLEAKLNYSKLLTYLSKAIYNEMKNKFVENLALRRNLHLDLKIGKRIYAQVG